MRLYFGNKERMFHLRNILDNTNRDIFFSHGFDFILLFFKKVEKYATYNITKMLWLYMCVPINNYCMTKISLNIQHGTQKFHKSAYT